MITYQEAGVSVEAGNELVQRIKKIVSKSTQKGPSIGGFSGLFPLPNTSGKTMLSGCCDGVGTKLKIAFLLDKHDTVGIDLVAMNVNDLLCQGARPLFFLDYFACGHLEVDTAESVVRGIHQGCEEAGCVLLGGETAEMPGFYPPGEYDLAGFAVGAVSKNKVVDGKKIKAGDILLGLPSSGVHSNGYSLVRKLFTEAELKSMGEELLAPTKIYVKQVFSILETKKSSLRGAIKGMAHITGGGWPENIPRMLPKGLEARIQSGSWTIPPIFRTIQERGQVSREEMFKTFNMGIGLVMAVSKNKLKAVQSALGESFVLGEIRKGYNGVNFQ